MPCNHKFLKDISLQTIGFAPTTLIVGTFIPEWPESDTAWFQGKTSGNLFWDILPRLYGEASLIDAPPAEWKRFCHDKHIAITDLISSIDDAEFGSAKHNKVLAGGDDDGIYYNFDDFDFTNIVHILQTHPDIKNVYLTRGVTEAFWRHLWNPVMQYCNQHGLHERKLMPPSAAPLYQHEVYNNEHPNNEITLPDYILMRWRQEWHA